MATLPFSSPHLVHRRVRAQPVEVLLPLDVPHHDTLPLAEDHWQGMVVVGVVPGPSAVVICTAVCGFVVGGGAGSKQAGVGGGGGWGGTGAVSRPGQPNRRYHIDYSICQDRGPAVGL